jgi:hypothetical protein
MATTGKKTRHTKQPPKLTGEVVDVDAMIASAARPGSSPVLLRFRGTEWQFKPITQAPIDLFDDSLDEAASSLHFLRTMLEEGQPPLPNDITLGEASAIVNGYTKGATGGLSAGK